MSTLPEPPRTKIVATIGPATSTPESMRALLERGMNVARINASHADLETHAETIAQLRRAAKATGKALGILLDLQGPKIRIGDFSGSPRELRSGDLFDLAVDRVPEAGELPTDYALLDRDVSVGHRLLINDGLLASVVTAVEPGRVRCRAQNDSVVAPRKGINLPDSHVSAPAVTEKDRADALFAIEHQVDAIALSFVRRAADVAELRTLVENAGGNLPIIAKIETQQALSNLEEIVRESWGVMVARGDLGVELSPEEVPMVQKRIIQTARRLNRPVITATEMLESMTRNPRPTRAESSDVANAVLDGTDAVMLSQETATGKYPLESLEMMARIILNTERSSLRGTAYWGRRREHEIGTTPEAVSDAACEVARQLGARALVAFTQSGMTAILTAARRPDTPILVFTNKRQVRNVLSLVWGVQPYLIREVNNTDRLVQELDATLIKSGLAEEGDRLVVLMGAPTKRMGPTNLLLVYDLGRYVERVDYD